MKAEKVRLVCLTIFIFVLFTLFYVFQISKDKYTNVLKIDVSKLNEGDIFIVNGAKGIDLGCGRLWILTQKSSNDMYIFYNSECEFEIRNATNLLKYDLRG